MAGGGNPQNSVQRRCREEHVPHLTVHGGDDGAEIPPPGALRLTCLARLAIVLELHTSGAGARVERLPRGQQAQVGAATIVLLTLCVDWGKRGRVRESSRTGPSTTPPTPSHHCYHRLFPNMRHPTSASPGVSSAQTPSSCAIGPITTAPHSTAPHCGPPPCQAFGLPRRAAIPPTSPSPGVGVLHPTHGPQPPTTRGSHVLQGPAKDTPPRRPPPAFPGQIWTRGGVPPCRRQCHSFPQASPQRTCN